MPSSLFSLATLVLVATPAVATSYSLLHNFDESNFFQNFSFYSETDPTAGFVQYLDYESACDAGLASIKSGNVYLGADFTNTYTTGGRPSTRVESNFEFTQGLLIADLAHMPGNACGVWPAFWTMGKDWPNNGEIDIIEGISNQTVNAMTLHTENQCSITTATQSGTLETSECSETDSYGGCTIDGTQGSYGDSFNDLGGGVYAVEWTSQYIKVWFFSRANIPDCITSGNPDPSTFGTPMASFQGSCDFESDFRGHSIIFNTDFCGSWAGSDFASSGCPMSVPDDATASCEAYVGANPSAFTEAYWEIVSVKVYQQASGSSSPSSSVSSAYSTSSTYSSSSASTSSTSKSSASSTSTSVISSTSTASRIVPTSPSAARSPSPAIHAFSSSIAVAGVAGALVQTTSSCSSKSTVTVTSVVTPSSAIASKSVTLVTSSAVVKPSANAVNTSSSKLTTTTVVVTSYVDVCPSGYTTKTITQTVTYCPADATSSSIGPVFTTTSKFCSTGCGPSPTTVIVVVPIESSTAVTTSESGAKTSSGHAVISTAVTVPLVTPGVSSSTRASSTIRVPAYVSSSAVSQASGSLGSSGSSPESGSVTSTAVSTAVSPAYTGAASKTRSSVLCLVAAVASFVLFI